MTHCTEAEILHETRISEAEFAALVSRSGPTLTPAQRQDIHDVYGLVEAMRRRRVLCTEMTEAMTGLDMVVTAVQPGEAVAIHEAPRWGMLERPSYTIPFNVTGQPAISVCTGFGPGGLPLGMQIVGKPFAEAMLFRTAHAYETATPWRQIRPAPDAIRVAAE